MKLLFLSLAIALGAGSAAAQSYDYLTLRQNDGTEQSLGIDGLTITFDDGQLVATNGAATVSVPLSDMQKMFFSSQATGIKTALTGDAVSATILNGRLSVNAPAGSQVSVWSADGRQMPAEGLSHGVYLVKINDRTFKVVAR